jgi:AcrR family transcriptional regulator
MSTPRPAARRKPPEERRAEIIKTAATIAVTEGLDKVTARRVADALRVFPGLVNHYFRSADELVAAAFTHATANESEDVYRNAEAATTALEQIQRLLHDWIDTERGNSISLLWLDAWQASRRRPALQTAVIDQMNADLDRLQTLIRAGIDNGQLHVTDPAGAATCVMALVDAMSIHAAVGTKIDYTPVNDMVFTNTEDMLGLPRGALRP